MTIDKIVADCKKLFVMYQEGRKNVTTANSKKFDKEFENKYGVSRVYGIYDTDSHLHKSVSVDDVLKVQDVDVIEIYIKGFLGIANRCKAAKIKFYHNSGTEACCMFHNQKLACALTRGEEVRVSGKAIVRFYPLYSENFERGIGKISIEFTENPKITRFK